MLFFAAPLFKCAPRRARPHSPPHDHCCKPTQTTHTPTHTPTHTHKQQQQNKPQVDVGDLRANTEYIGFSPSSPSIAWFWQVVDELDKQGLAQLLQFVTGTSKVPLGGFAALQGISGPQRFQIQRAYGAADRLPSAHTCFNQLDLPEYGSKEQLAARLRMAISEGHEGFGFG